MNKLAGLQSTKVRPEEQKEKENIQAEVQVMMVEL